ncbi:hypothetical protein, partial [Escherichia coli]|uniref:hypothetical protein n=1 Tax=Escherichia coli TaxID=562 RepID=UPI0013C2E0B4
ISKNRARASLTRGFFLPCVYRGYAAIRAAGSQNTSDALDLPQHGRYDLPRYATGMVESKQRVSRYNPFFCLPVAQSFAVGWGR